MAGSPACWSSSRADMEGVAGIVDWAQCLPGGDDDALGRALLLGEVRAAIEGARQRRDTDHGQ